MMKKSSHPGVRLEKKRMYSREREHIHEMTINVIVKASKGARWLRKGGYR
jgi:hypothetical protein